MARKAYSEQEREQVREALLNTVIQCIVDRGLIHSSIDVLCKKWGILQKDLFLHLLFLQGRTGIGSASVSAAQATAIRPEADGRSHTQFGGKASERFWRLALTVRKKALPCYPLKKNKKFTAVFPKKISRLP